MADTEKEEISSEEKGSKEEKKFNANLSKIIALFQGESLFKNSKLKGSEIEAVIVELTKEKKELKLAEFKTKAKALIESKIAFNKFRIEKEKELKNALEAKMKEFNKEAEALLSMVEDISNIEKDYKNTLLQEEEDKE